MAFKTSKVSTGMELCRTEAFVQQFSSALPVKSVREPQSVHSCPSNITRWALKSKIPAHQGSNNNPITPAKGLALTDDLAMSLIRHKLLSKWCVLRLLASVREWVDMAFFSVIWNELLEIKTLKKKFRLVISFLFLLVQAKVSSLSLPSFSFPTFCTT